MLITDNLVVGYDKKPILPPLNLALGKGELIGILGSNGAGKSSLLRTLSAAQAPLSGKIMVAGRDIKSCSARELAKLIAIVYTDHVQSGGLTARQVVALGRHPHISALSRFRSEDNEAVDKALETVGIASFANRYLSRLSDGERQKVMIARTLAQETPVIFLDEPTTFLDIASRLEMFQLVKRLADDLGKAVVISTHEVAPLLSVASNLWLITHDRKFITGNTADIVADGTINSLFPSSKGVVFSPALNDFVIA